MNFKNILKKIKFRFIGNKMPENKVKLIRLNKYNYVTVKFSPNLIIAENKMNIKLLSEKIEKFLSVLDSECKNFDETLFGINGIIKFDGRINLRLESFQASDHELLHLASVNFDNNKNTLKFLNEGYTEFLSERYFGKNTEYVVYPFETLIKL